MDRSASEPLRRVTLLLKLWIIGFLHSVLVLHFHFTLRAFTRLFYPKRLATSTFVRGRSNKSIAVGTVRVSIDPSAKQQQSLAYPSPVYNRDS